MRPTEERHWREQAQKYLGKAYTKRLGAAYATLVDAEGLLKEISDSGNFGSSLRNVCDAFRELREKARLNF